jgi:DNA-binding MarR family transcriptional regulator
MANRRPTFHLALHVAKLVEDQLRVLLGAEGGQHGQARILDALDRAGPRSVSALARALHVAQPTATLLVKRLESSRLVCRRGADDRRVSSIELTAKGRRAVAAVHRGWAEVEARLQACLTQEENETLHALLSRVRDGLGGESPDFESLETEWHAQVARPAKARTS